MITTVDLGYDAGEKSEIFCRQRDGLKRDFVSAVVILCEGLCPELHEKFKNMEEKGMYVSPEEKVSAYFLCMARLQYDRDVALIAFRRAVKDNDRLRQLKLL